MAVGDVRIEDLERPRIAGVDDVIEAAVARGVNIHQPDHLRGLLQRIFDECTGDEVVRQAGERGRQAAEEVDQAPALAERASSADGAAGEKLSEMSCPLSVVSGAADNGQQIRVSTQL